MKQGYTFKRCACTAGAACPKLKDRHHGSWFWSARIDTSGGRKLVRRGGFAKQGDAAAALATVTELAALATDDRTRAQVGDMIVKATMRGGQLPDVRDVKRRLGLGAAPGDAGVTFGEAWPPFLNGNEDLKLSARERLTQIGAHWLLPVLKDVPLERLNGTHCQDVFDRIDAVNAEITRQRGTGRAWIHVEGDVRQRPKLVGNASKHRVFAALRSFCNFEVRVTRRMEFNPIYAVRLKAEKKTEQKHWTADEAARFLAFTADDELGLLFRIAVLRGSRRGELCGLRWAGSDLSDVNAASLVIEKTILLVGAKVHEETPKTDASERVVWLDPETARLLREHRKVQLAARLRAGSAWQDNDLIFCREDGSPFRPDYVYRRLQRLAQDAGVPVIRLHDAGRHTAVSLMRGAGVDRDVRMREVGHVTEAVHARYTHIERAAHLAAAAQVADLVAKAGDQ